MQQTNVDTVAEGSFCTMSPVVVGRWKFGRGADPNPVIKVTSKVTPSALKEEISYSGNGRTRNAIICRPRRGQSDPLLQVQSWTKTDKMFCVNLSVKWEATSGWTLSPSAYNLTDTRTARGAIKLAKKFNWQFRMRGIFRGLAQGRHMTPYLGLENNVCRTCEGSGRDSLWQFSTCVDSLSKLPIWDNHSHWSWGRAALQFFHMNDE